MALTSALAAPVFAGTIKGTVELLEKSSRKTADLTEVVVWVEGVKAKPKPGRASMGMKGKTFTPHVIAVGVGSTVDFPNDDPIFHNVFSVSGENRFDLPLYKRPKSLPQTFPHAGVVRVYCNIHPQMSAVVLVRDNPYFTKAAADGTFTIEGVPAGKYKLTAWHDKGGETTQDVTVPAQGAVEARPISLDASKFKQLPHKDKYGKDYSTGDKY